MYESPKFIPAGDSAVVIELGDEISPECNRAVHALCKTLTDEHIPAVRDIIPTYRSILVQYDAAQSSYDDMKSILSNFPPSAEDASIAPLIHIPVLYGGKHGPDLEDVARSAGITPQEVIDIHSNAEYLVYMMGFTPGFPYLGGMPPKIAAPRRTTPRAAIPQGSVGIAETQTGVYPIESPGGWQLIGRTPLTLFDPQRDTPSLLDAGARVKFQPLPSEDEYQRIQQHVQLDEYRPATHAKE